MSEFFIDLAIGLIVTAILSAVAMHARYRAGDQL